MSEPRVYELKALTDLWTGDAAGKQDRTISTGLLGSIRWWFEVVVRGLGGSACDPSDPRSRCPHRQGRRCVVCELFGCTGWARKFRFDVLDAEGNAQQDQITRGQSFLLRFTPLRPVAKEEWALLDMTLRLIAEYGAIGGKTVYKSSDELALADASLDDINDALVLQRAVRGSPLKKKDRVIQVDGRNVTSRSELAASLTNRPVGESVAIAIERNGADVTIDGWIGKRHHQDFGLVEITSSSSEMRGSSKDDLERYVEEKRWRKVQHGGFAWASLKDFWCVTGRYLGRQNANASTFNQVIERPEAKSNAGQNDSWLAGRRARKAQKRRAEIQPESKKVFSFRQPPRTFGFTNGKQVSLDTIKSRLRSAWDDLDDAEVRGGAAILNALLGKATP